MFLDSTSPRSTPHLQLPTLLTPPLLFALFLLAAQPALGQIYSTAQGGLWDAPATWEGGVIPGPTDNAVIRTGATVVLEADLVSEDVETEVSALHIEADATLEGAPFGELHIYGALTNAGTIHGGDAPYMFIVHAHQDVESPGLINAQFRLAGEGPRTIRIIDSPFYLSSHGDVVLVGDNIAPGMTAVEGRLTLERGATWQIQSMEGTDAFLADSFVSNAFENLGVVRGNCQLLDFGFELLQCGSPSLFVSFQSALDDQESVRLETHGGRTHPRFPSRSVAGWWTIDYESSTPAEGMLNLNFRDADVWFLTEDYESLRIQYSPDGGVTWETPDLEVQYTQFQESANTGTISTRGTIRPGTYVLEVEGEPVAATTQGGVITSTRGRQEIRVGAPNDYRVRYANSSDRETGPFLMSITLPEGMPITAFRPSPVPGEAMSSGPQAASATTLQPRTSERVRLITADSPS